MKIYAVLCRPSMSGEIKLVTTEGWTHSSKSDYDYMVATTKEEFDELLNRFAFKGSLGKADSKFFTVEIDV